MSKQAQNFRNTLYTHDNLYVLCGLDSSLVDLIYLDPPFNSKRMYSATIGSKAAGATFKDIWTWKDVDEHYLDTLAANYPALAKYIANVGAIHGKPMMAYLTFMAQRIIEMYRILKDTGTLYLHCDPTAGHYLKLLLDCIFGNRGFVNEIVWHYHWGIHVSTRWNRKHDTIFMYTKSGGKKMVFNADAVREPYSATSQMTKDPKWNKSFNAKGKLPEDVWYIPTINAMAKERTGYPTQKPLALLKRIVLASSNEGDIVLDPFCGCATTCVAAQQLGRKWIGIDTEKQAVKFLIERLSNDTEQFNDFIATNQVPKRTDWKIVLPSESVKQRLYKEQDAKCNACGQDFDLHNVNLDYIIPKAKRGGDYYENYQLLCGSCYRIKEDSPMEYLRMKIETRERMMNTQIFFGGKNDKKPSTRAMQ